MIGLDDIIGAGLRIVDKLIPDPQARAAAALEAAKMKQAGDFKDLEALIASDQGQVEINKTEAASPDFFTRGWRPGVWWVCVLGLLYQFLLRPFLVTAGYAAPALDVESLMTLLFGVLGLGLYRTKERLAGVSR